MVRLLRRFVHVLALAFVFVQASGMTKVFAEDVCEARCPGDDDHGNCPSNCTDCVCCVRLPSVAPPVGSDIAAPLGAALGPAHPTGLPPKVDPRRIEHVPKVSRA